MAQLHDLTALEQSAAVRAGETSTAELVEHYLDRIDRLGQTVGAFITVTAGAARTAAARADAARPCPHVPAASMLTSDGPLAGVPTAVKDLNQTRGVRTTMGSALLVDNVPDVDDAVVESMARAGMISLGKTNTPEFGLPCYTENDIAAPARTPWDLDRSAGGSSGGAAAAVAAGLVPLAQGSDGGGSIRVPASVCGLVGIKPTRGRVSAAPLGPDVAGLSTSGPLARTVADAAALLDVLRGPVTGDPHWATDPDRTYAEHARRDPGRLRIGRYREPIVPDAELHSDCLAAWNAASELLVELGHDVEDIARPAGPDLVPDFEVVWATGAAAAPVPAEAESRLRPLTRWMREKGRRYSGAEFVTAVTRLWQASRAAIVATDAYDAVLTPTLALPPVPVGWFTGPGDPAEDFARQFAFTPFSSLYNITGQPAVSLPTYRTPSGLPIGVQLVGRPADEATLVALAAQLESELRWYAVHPPIWQH